MLPYLAGAAALVFAGYHTMGPRSQLYGHTVVRDTLPSRRLALTFDDGPSDPCTLRLLEVLARHEVRATFFMIGRAVEHHPEIARAVASAGHSIGNHTFTHSLLTLLPATRICAEIEGCDRVLREIIGRPSVLFRPPYGGRRPGVLKVARQRGLKTIMWAAAGKDWQTQSPEAIEANVLQGLQGGEIVLLHDGSPAGTGNDRLGTVQAVDRLIPRLRDHGYALVTVEQMLQSSLPSGDPQSGNAPPGYL